MQTWQIRIAAMIAVTAIFSPAIGTRADAGEPRIVADGFSQAAFSIGNLLLSEKHRRNNDLQESCTEPIVYTGVGEQIPSRPGDATQFRSVDIQFITRNPRKYAHDFFVRAHGTYIEYAKVQPAYARSKIDTKPASYVGLVRLAIPESALSGAISHALPKADCISRAVYFFSDAKTKTSTLKINVPISDAPQMPISYPVKAFIDPNPIVEIPIEEPRGTTTCSNMDKPPVPLPDQVNIPSFTYVPGDDRETMGAVGVQIDINGNARRVRLLRSTGYEIIDQEMLHAYAVAKYTPAIVNCRPAAGEWRMTVRFTAEDVEPNK